MVKKYFPYPLHKMNSPIHTRGLWDLQQKILLVSDNSISTVTGTFQKHNVWLSSRFLFSIIVIIAIIVRLGTSFA